MASFEFVYGECDEYGSTVIPKKTFEDILELNHNAIIIVERVSGMKYETHAVKCISMKRRYYHIDLSHLGIGRGARVTLNPIGKNKLRAVVLETPENMWVRRGVIDAIVELQRDVKMLRDAIFGDDESVCECCGDDCDDSSM